MKMEWIRAGVLASVAAAGMTAQTAVTEVPSTLSKNANPTVDTVLDHFLDATGGKAANDAIKTRISIGTFSLIGKGIAGTYKMYQEAPAKAYTVLDIEGVGKTEDGTDGKIAWELSALTGARIKDGAEAATEMRDSSLDAHTHWKNYYKSAEVSGSDNIGDKSCWRVVMTPNQGEPETDWFDKTSGLLVRESATLDTPMGKVPVQADYSDYRKQGDVVLPFKMTQTLAGQQYEVALEKVDLNTDIPAHRFDLPSEIAALKK